MADTRNIQDALGIPLTQLPPADPGVVAAVLEETDEGPLEAATALLAARTADGQLPYERYVEVAGVIAEQMALLLQETTATLLRAYPRRKQAAQLLMALGQKSPEGLTQKGHLQDGVAHAVTSILEDIRPADLMPLLSHSKQRKLLRRVLQGIMQWSSSPDHRLGWSATLDALDALG